MQSKVTGAIKEGNGRLLVELETDPVENNYPRHPIRTGEHGLIWFATFEKFGSLNLAGVTERHLIPTRTSAMR